MVDQQRSANPLFLREQELLDGVEAFLRAWTQFSASADTALQSAGLGRAHHRVLYFIARHPDLSVGDLLHLLDVTKQSLGRVMTPLIKQGLVEARPGVTDRRQKRLRLTADGVVIERQLSAAFCRAFSDAYRLSGADAVGGFRTVLDHLARDSD